MRYEQLRVIASAAGALTIAAIALFSSASASSSQMVVYNFTGGDDGGNAATTVAFTATGRAIVTTVQGGSDGCGTVDELTPTSGLWTERTLWTFTCFNDGKNPHGGVTIDALGNMYGTTVAGGNGGQCVGDGCGVIYRIGPHGGFTVLYNFKGLDDGFGPGNPVAVDSNGNLYGDTPDGGKHGLGVVYELSHVGNRWVLTVLHAFSGRNDGATGSLGPLLVDSAGNVFGVTETAGLHQAGNVFEISPGSNNTHTFKVLYQFKGTPDAAFPYGGVIADGSGDLYGTTYFGGATGNGTVYELIPRLTGGYAERVLHSFSGGADGGNPLSTLVFNPAGFLFGTTSAGGGSCGCGTIFKILHKNLTTLHQFGSTQTDGQYPLYGLAPDANGNMFTSTVAGGDFGQGVIYGIAP